MLKIEIEKSVSDENHKSAELMGIIEIKTKDLQIKDEQIKKITDEVNDNLNLIKEKEDLLKKDKEKL